MLLAEVKGNADITQCFPRHASLTSLSLLKFRLELLDYSLNAPLEQGCSLYKSGHANHPPGGLGTNIRIREYIMFNTCLGVDEILFAKTWYTPVLVSPIPSSLCLINNKGTEP